MALDEFTDIVEIAQLLFIQEVSASLEVTKELASINSYHGTTGSENNFKEFEKTRI